MRRFVIRQNIERYTDLLKRRDLEPSRRHMLERLLDEERAKLAASEEDDEEAPERGSDHPLARD